VSNNKAGDNSSAGSDCKKNQKVNNDESYKGEKFGVEDH
jgi:hypothetical protein